MKRKCLACHPSQVIRETISRIARVTVSSGTQTAVSSQRTVQPSPWQQHISVPQQLENTHYSQVTLIHSGPVLTHCSLYYQYQECYNSFPQWRLVLNSLSHLGGQRFSGVMVMSARETGELAMAD